MTADVFNQYRQRHLACGPRDDEGYCQPCNRIVAVAPDGLILPHTVYGTTQSACVGWRPERCEGTGQKEWETPKDE